MRGKESRARKKASHPFLRWMGIVAFSLASGMIGTLLHRSGADQGVPWGLVLAFLLVFFSACWARRVEGFLGLAVNLLLSTSLIWLVAGNYGPGGDILVPVASKAFVTFWSRYDGYIWILGATLVQLLVLALPKAWFHKESR